MKQLILEIGNAKEKTDKTFLYNKARTETILLKFSFDELRKLIKRENEKLSKREMA